MRLTRAPFVLVLVAVAALSAQTTPHAQQPASATE